MAGDAFAGVMDMACYRKKIRRGRTLVAIFALQALVGLSCGHVSAGEDIVNMDTWPSRQEFDTLPQYCLVRAAHSSDQSAAEKVGGLTPAMVKEGKRWKQVLGANTFVSSHHYCAGLNWVQRFQQSLLAAGGGAGELTTRQRAALERGLGQFRYMEGVMVAEKSVLLPEMLYNQGFVYRYLGEKEKAVARLMDAIKVKKDFVLPYLLLAEMSEEDGDLPGARKILELGLQNTGGSKAIEARLQPPGEE